MSPASSTCFFSVSVPLKKPDESRLDGCILQYETCTSMRLRSMVRAVGRQQADFVKLLSYDLFFSVCTPLILTALTSHLLLTPCSSHSRQLICAVWSRWVTSLFLTATKHSESQLLAQTDNIVDLFTDSASCRTSDTLSKDQWYRAWWIIHSCCIQLSTNWLFRNLASICEKDRLCAAQ